MKYLMDRVCSRRLERNNMMDELKEIRWKQRYENFNKSYKLLNKYAHTELKTELEIAGMIQLFEMTFELAWKVLKDYLESQGFEVKSPRETIKQAFQIGVIEEGHVWIDALANRNLSVHTYDQELANTLVREIVKSYLPAITKMHDRLEKEL